MQHDAGSKCSKYVNSFPIDKIYIKSRVRALMHVRIYQRVSVATAFVTDTETLAL